MPRAEVISSGGRGEAAPRPSSAPAEELAALPQLSLHELRVRWRKLHRTTPPPHLTRPLLLRMVAYKLQANALGDLDRETARFLDRVAQKLTKGARQKGLVPPVSEKGMLKAGAVLVREHDGALHRVTVLEAGFSWQDRTYRSLSEVARAITGTNWNGPRFFGLRDGPKTTRTSSAPEEAHP
jgi:hypothetical protein